jgi:DHA2 family multidrug resistance protein
VVFLLTRNSQIVHAELAGHVTPYNDPLNAPATSHIWNMATVAGRAALNAEVTKQATVVAYADDFKLMMIVALMALPLVFLLKRPRRGRGRRRCWSRSGRRRHCDAIPSAD